MIFCNNCSKQIVGAMVIQPIGNLGLTADLHFHPNCYGKPVESFNPNDGWDQTKTSVDETSRNQEPSS